MTQNKSHSLSESTMIPGQITACICQFKGFKPTCLESVFQAMRTLPRDEHTAQAQISA